MSITLNQFETEIRSMPWRLPDRIMPNLWGSEGKMIMPVARLQKIINDALLEWAKENSLERETWTLDDGSGGEGTLTAGQRAYAMANDQAIITDVYVNYDDSNDYRGTKLEFANSNNLVADPTDTSPDADLPLRIFIWEDVFELDPIPDDAYTMRFYGYQFPDDLSESSDVPGSLEVYHQTILRKCKVLVAEAIGAVNSLEIAGQYEKSRMEDKKFDERRHRSVRVMNSNTGFWS